MFCMSINFRKKSLSNSSCFKNFNGFNFHLWFVSTSDIKYRFKISLENYFTCPNLLAKITKIIAQ